MVWILINIFFFLFLLCLQVSSQETQYIPGNDDLIASRQSLKLHLQSIHFQSPIPMSQLNSIYADPRPTGALVLRCTAQIGNLYQEFREINLGVPQRDPVPARGEWNFVR